MDLMIHKAKGLSPDQRFAVESLIGHTLWELETAMNLIGARRIRQHKTPDWNCTLEPRA